MTTDATVEAALGELLASAPPSLAPRTLTEVGLADWYTRMPSPIGELVVAWNGLGVATVEAAADDTAFETAHRARTGRVAYRADHLPDRLANAITRRLEGERRVRIDLDLRGHTEFERDVWLKALEIPHGEVRPYGWIAKEIGHPGAVRAAGSALAKNPVPLLIPCHRVVRSDGHIGRYSLGGARNKRRLLEVEGVQPELLERLAASGVRYLGNAEKKYFCYPTCGGIETLVQSNKVRFRSEREAVAAGYHPCGDCRPPVAQAG